MKKIFLTLLVILAAFGLSQSPLALADNGYSGFDVSEILDFDTDDAESGGNSTDIFENIVKDADDNNTSIVGAIILRAINLLSLLVGTFTFVTILIGGLMMITANGDENKIDRSKGILVQSILGAVLAFAAYFITAFVQSFFY